MNLDDVVDDEFHPSQADSLAGQAPPAKSGGRAGDVHHDPGPQLRQVGEVDLRLGKRQPTGIDPPFVAFGAG